MDKRRKKKVNIGLIVLLIMIVVAIVLLIYLLVLISKARKGGTETETVRHTVEAPAVTEGQLPGGDTTGEDGSSQDVTTGDNTGDNTGETVLDETTADNTVDPTKGDETPTQAPPADGQLLNSGYEVQITPGTDFSEFSSEQVPYGYGGEVDDNNRPGGCTWYDNKYGQYACDFIQPYSNYVYLTMDEGYEYGLTPQILDTLKEKNVKCVFFVTLPFAKDNPDLVKRMIDEGHVVGNHTTTHPAGGLQQYDPQKQIEDIDGVTRYIKDNYNYDMYLFRFPEGSFSEQSLAIVQSLGYRAVFWSFAYKDWDVNNQPDYNESLQNALDKAHGGAIYLLHAESKTNADMLGDFIDGIRAKGFEFGYYSKMD